MKINLLLLLDIIALLLFIGAFYLGFYQGAWSKATFSLLICIILWRCIKCDWLYEDDEDEFNY